MTIEKYGYETDKEKTKTASDKKSKDRCPLCGAMLTGQPPTCPNHGSEPFEKRERNGQE